MKKIIIFALIIYSYCSVIGQNINKDICTCFKMAINTEEFKEMFCTFDTKDTINIIGNFNLNICNELKLCNKVFLFDSVFPKYINKQVEKNTEEIMEKAKGTLIFEYKSKNKSVKFLFWEPSTNALLILEVKRRKKINILFDGVM